MKFLLLETQNPYFNLAVEEYFFKKTEETVFIFWQNEPSVVIGKNQNINAELNLDYVKEKNIHIVRRITGGGAVYHDLGNINYSFISGTRTEGIDFAYFTKPIIDALRSLGVNVSLSGRNDIEIDNKKISGNAQCTADGRTLHHGTLLFDTDLDVLSKALHVDEEKIKAKAIRSTRSRVTNLKSYLNMKSSRELIEYLSEYIINEFSPEIVSVPSDQYINELFERNMSEDWLFPKNKFLSVYTLKKKKKYSFGLVEVEASLEGSKISYINIFGDFFGTKDIKELCEKLKGKTLNELSSFDIGSYISGMTNAEFSDLLIN